LPEKEATIKIDREKLYAILINLVKNAIKYTEKGSIELGYNLKTEPNQQKKPLTGNLHLQEKTMMSEN